MQTLRLLFCEVGGLQVEDGVGGESVLAEVAGVADLLEPCWALMAARR
jgi:hypothetical protein